MNTPDPHADDTTPYQSRPLPPHSATCASCGHAGLDHHHAGTRCWANLPRTIGSNGVWGPVRVCACAAFKAAQ